MVSPFWKNAPHRSEGGDHSERAAVEGLVVVSHPPVDCEEAAYKEVGYEIWEVTSVGVVVGRSHQSSYFDKNYLKGVGVAGLG